MNGRIVGTMIEILSTMYSQSDMDTYFSLNCDIPKERIDKYSGSRSKLVKGLMDDLYNSGKKSDKKIIQNIAEDLIFNDNYDRFYYYPEKKQFLESSLGRLSTLLSEDGYYGDTGKLMRKPLLIDDIDSKYENIITNLENYGRNDLSTTFKEAKKNYATDSGNSLASMRSIIENLNKHILKVNKFNLGNAKPNMEKLKDIGVLKEPSSKYKDNEITFSYELFKMLSNWGVHHPGTPSLERDYLFETSILYLDFLINRINQSGVKTS